MNVCNQHTSSTSPGQKIDITIDSAASDSYIRPEDKALLKNIEPYTGTPVLLPDADTLNPIEQGQLHLHPEFSSTASTSTVLDKLKSASLLSVGKLCDKNKLVVFDNEKVRTIKRTPAIDAQLDMQPVLLQGHRSPIDNLWHTTLPM